MKKISRRIIVICLIILFLAAGGIAGVKYLDAHSNLSFNKNSVHMLQNRNMTLKAYNVSKTTGEKKRDKHVRWFSTNPFVASVDIKTGVITAKKTGNCKIYCISKSRQLKSIDVQVMEYVIPEDHTFVAHRGVQDKYPENTLEGFAGAMDIGYKGIECDVWESDNGDLMVFHDKTTERMCDEDVSIQEVNSSNREQYLITKGVNIEEYGSLLIPTLEETLQLIKERDGVIFIHLKYKGGFSETGLKKVVSLIKDYDMAEQAVVFAANQENLLTLHSYGVKTGLLVHAEETEEVLSYIDWCEEKEIDYLYFMDVKQVQKQYIDLCLEKGITVGVYRVKTLGQVLKLMNMNVDFMMLYHNVFYETAD